MCAVCLWVAVAVLFSLSSWFPRAGLDQLKQATAGWVQPTLVGSLAAALVAYALVFGPGRQRAGDVGWRTAAIAPALLVTALLWLAMQLAGWLAVGFGNWPGLHRNWLAGAGVALGPLIAQLCATALFEETLFRGWLWPQLGLRLRGWVSPWLAVALALLLSQALFALLHLPGLLHAGIGGNALGAALLMLFVSGLVLALVYAATGNLFIAVGVHALGNAPMPLFAGMDRGLANNVLLAGALVVAIAAALLRRKRRR